MQLWKTNFSAIMETQQSRTAQGESKGGFASSSENHEFLLL